LALRHSTDWIGWIQQAKKSSLIVKHDLNMKPRHCAGFFTSAQRLLLADSRSLGYGSQRPFTRKLSLKLDGSAAISDPQQSFEDGLLSV
jgi:hypothetical protein